MVGSNRCEGREEKEVEGAEMEVDEQKVEEREGEQERRYSFEREVSISAGRV
jgi:hypothetical protein